MSRLPTNGYCQLHRRRNGMAPVSDPSIRNRPTSRRGLVVLALSAALSACEMFSSGSGRVVDPPRLSISNQTSLFVTLFVNGATVATYAPGGHEDPISTDRLPPAPWHAEVRTSSGRLLLALRVAPGDIWHTGPDQFGHSSLKGNGIRADLSCGRLDLWAGPPMAGPPPPSSFPPGDCDP